MPKHIVCNDYDLAEVLHGPLRGVIRSVNMCYHLLCRCFPYVFLRTVLQTFDECSSWRWWQHQSDSYSLKWAAESELRLARGGDLRSVPRRYVSLSACSCMFISVKLVFTVCSNHAFDGEQQRQRMRVCAFILIMRVCACVRVATWRFLNLSIVTRSFCLI